MAAAEKIEVTFGQPFAGIPQPIKKGSDQKLVLCLIKNDPVSCPRQR